jgi:TM2 domain-containing membrane protein YozV
MGKFGFSKPSWRRALGVSAAKGKVSRAIGIPLTKSGRQKKLGRLAEKSLVPAAVASVAVAATAVALSSKRDSPGKDQRSQEVIPVAELVAAPGCCSRPVYMLLAFFLGWTGAHNFYARRVRAALIQIGLALGFGVSLPFLIPLVWFWAWLEMLIVNRDGLGVRMVWKRP